MDQPESTCRRVSDIPQCCKSFTLEEAHSFADRVIQLFHALEGMSDLRSLYEAGKQLSRLYFDCPQHRVQLAQYLTTLQYPGFASRMMKRLNNMGVFKNDDIWFSSFYLYNTVWNFSDAWPAFASALANASLPNLLKLNIGHQPYLDNLLSKNVYYLMKASISILHNIVRVPGNLHYFGAEGIKSSLVSLCLREEDFLRCIACLCLAYILSEEDAHLINTPTSSELGGRTILQSLFDYILLARAQEKRRCHGFQVSDLLAALCALAVNDNAKADILELNSATPSEDTCCLQLIRQALEMQLQPQSTSLMQREAAESVRLLWSLAMAPISSLTFAKLRQELAPWLDDLLTQNTSANLPVYVRRALEAVSFRLSSGAGARAGGFATQTRTQILVSHAQCDRRLAVSIAENLRTANLPVVLSEAELSHLEAGSVGLSGHLASARSFSHWRRLLDTTCIAIVCASEEYRLSPGCRQEAEYLASVLTDRFFIPVSLQAKYRPTGWLAACLTNRSPLEVTSRRSLDAALNSLLAQTQEVFFELRRCSRLDSFTIGGHFEPMSSGVNQESRPLSAASAGPSPSMRRNSRSPKTFRPLVAPLFQSTHNSHLVGEPRLLARRMAIRPEVRMWSPNEVAAWLRFCGNSHIFQVTGAFDGVLLSQLAALRLWAPEYFAQSLQSELRLSFVDGLRFIEALDELAPSGFNEDFSFHNEKYRQADDAYSQNQ